MRAFRPLLAFAALCILSVHAAAAPARLIWKVEGTTGNGVFTGSIGIVVVGDDGFLVGSVFSVGAVNSRKYSVVPLRKKGDSGCRTVHTQLMDTTETYCVTLVERAADGLTLRSDRRSTFNAIAGGRGKVHEIVQVALKFDATSCSVQLLDASRTFMDTGDQMFPIESVRTQTCTLEAQK